LGEPTLGEPTLSEPSLDESTFSPNRLMSLVEFLSEQKNFLGGYRHKLDMQNLDKDFLLLTEGKI